MDFRFLRVLEILKEWISVAVDLVTVLVAILTFLRARQVGGWKAFGLGPAPQGDAETTAENIKRLIAEAVPGASPESKQYLLLKEYHAQGIAQSKISFWFSLVFATLGFAVIVSGLLAFQSDKDFSKQAGSFVPIIAGTIIDASQVCFSFSRTKRGS